jgi:hypothetical protein
LAGVKSKKMGIQGIQLEAGHIQDLQLCTPWTAWSCNMYCSARDKRLAFDRANIYPVYSVGWLGAFGLLLPCRTHCVLQGKSKPNTHTPPTIWDKYSPNSVSCIIGFSTLYTSMWGQTSQLQDQWPWWQRTFLGHVNPKSHGVCACLRPSDPRSP